LALKFLNAWGCEVTAFTTSEAKRKEALDLGAHHTLNSKSVEELDAAAGSFDLIISTVNVKLDWNRNLMTLKARGRLHFVGMIVKPLDIGVGSLIIGQRSVSGSAVGSPSTIAKMLEFAKLHDIKPVIEKYKFSQVNEAIEHLHSGKAHYRIVLER